MLSINDYTLYYKSVGEGETVIILHGLFGTADNWRTFGGWLKNHFQVILVDLRNHGRSFWSDKFDYNLASNDVIKLLDELKISRCHIIGHSMGGKIALTIAQNFPGHVDKMVIVDIGYKRYPPGHQLIFNAILSMNLTGLKSRKEADEILSQSIPNNAIRQFLLKSLKRNPKAGFIWKTNFEALHNNYQNILAEVVIDDVAAETLFVKGEKSEYILLEDYQFIKSKFNKANIIEIDTGHWIHAEQPKELFKLVTAFLSVNKI